jgi:hypothetical protein
MASLNHNFFLSEREIFLRGALDSSGKTGGGFSFARRAEKDTVQVTAARLSSFLRDDLVCPLPQQRTFLEATATSAKWPEAGVPALANVR